MNILDLLNIAKTEADGNDLLKLISSLYKSSDIKPKRYSFAVLHYSFNNYYCNDLEMITIVTIVEILTCIKLTSM